MAEEIVAKLREELIDCQKTRSEFLRWKLILVAAVGSVALGIGGERQAGVPLLLALIPLICLYVDSVCVHNDSKIMLIAEFLRGPDHDSPVARKYEELCHAKRSAFLFEGFALFASTMLLSLVVAAVGLVAALWRPQAVTIDGTVAWVLTGAGTVGFAVALWLYEEYRRIQSIGEHRSDTVGALSGSGGPVEPGGPARG